MASVDHDIVVVGAFRSLVRREGHHGGCRMRSGSACPSGAPDFASGFHGGSCCPVICVSLFHVIVLSFEFLLFLLFGCLVSIYFLINHIFYKVMLAGFVSHSLISKLLFNKNNV